MNESAFLLDLLLRFLLVFFFNMGQMRIISKHSEASRHNVYSFFIISIVVFFLSHTLSSIEMQIGMAIGMFAVFGIVRYRTEALQPKEMTYLFSAIGIAVIDALTTGFMGYTELIVINLIVLLFIYVLERFLIVENNTKESVATRKLSVVLPIEDLNATQINAKQQELQSNLGVTIVRHHISKIDYTAGHAQLTYFYEK